MLHQIDYEGTPHEFELRRAAASDADWSFRVRVREVDATLRKVTAIELFRDGGAGRVSLGRGEHIGSGVVRIVVPDRLMTTNREAFELAVISGGGHLVVARGALLST